MRNQVSPELRRNVGNKMVFGVASGLADYFGVDVAIIRVLFVVTAFLSAGTTLLIYLLLAIFVPEQERPGTSGPSSTGAGGESETGSPSSSQGSPDQANTSSSDPVLVERRHNLAGWIVIVLGVVLLATNFGLFRWLSFGRFWPVLLIALGAALILGVFKNQGQRD